MFLVKSLISFSCLTSYVRLDLCFLIFIIFYNFKKIVKYINLLNFKKHKSNLT